jgi:hypothetical protein
MSDDALGFFDGFLDSIEASLQLVGELEEELEKVRDSKADAIDGPIAA